MPETPILVILTEHPSLRLRLLHETDADELFALVDRNRAHLRTWLPWIDANTAAGHSLAFIQAMRRQHAEGRGFTCGLFLKSKLIGVTGPHVMDTFNRSCQVGYWLDRDHCNRGLMTAAVRALISYAFVTLKINRIEIRAATDNEASQAVCTRLGFIREGITRDAEWLYDHYVDLTVNRLLLREWQTTQVEDERAP